MPLKSTLILTHFFLYILGSKEHQCHSTTQTTVNFTKDIWLIQDIYFQNRFGKTCMSNIVSSKWFIIKKNTFAVISFMWFLFLWNGHCRKIKNPISILDLYVGIWNYESKRLFYTFKRHFWLYHGVQFFIWWTGSQSTQRKPPTCDNCINNQNTEEKKFYKNNICRSSEDLIYLSKLQNNTDAATIYGNWGSINRIIKSEIK